MAAARSEEVGLNMSAEKIAEMLIALVKDDDAKVFPIDNFQLPNVLDNWSSVYYRLAGIFPLFLIPPPSAVTGIDTVFFVTGIDSSNSRLIS